jgi:hypothetical protein
MHPKEIERRRAAAQADTLRLTLDETIGIRAIDAGAGEVLAAAHVGDRDRRACVLRIIQSQFPEAAVKFEP